MHAGLPHDGHELFYLHRFVSVMELADRLDLLTDVLRDGHDAV